MTKTNHKKNLKKHELENHSSTSSSELIALFNKKFDLSDSLEHSEENSKCSTKNDLTSGEDNNYNVDTQETNYNLEVETEYSDFDSLNDSENINIPVNCQKEFSDKSNSSIEVDLTSGESERGSIEEPKEQESEGEEEEESELEENGIILELDSLVLKLDLNGLARMKELGFKFQSNIKVYNKKKLANSDCY